MYSGLGLEDHIRRRDRVCVTCYRKGDKSISKKEVEYIQNNLINGFSKDNLDFSSALCNGCHLKLHNKMTGKEAELPTVESYDPESPQLLRDYCQFTCKMCQVAKSSINSQLKKKRGRPKADETPEAQETGASQLVICSKCFSKIGKGYAHDCSRRGKFSNIQNLLAATPTSAQRFTLRVVSELDTPFLPTLVQSRRKFPHSFYACHGAEWSYSSIKANLRARKKINVKVVWKKACFS